MRKKKNKLINKLQASGREYKSKTWEKHIGNNNIKLIKKYVWIPLRWRKRTKVKK